METPDVTSAQSGSILIAVLAVVSSVVVDASQMVSIAGLACATVIGVAWMISDALIRKGRAGVVEAMEYNTAFRSKSVEE